MSKSIFIGIVFLLSYLKPYTQTRISASEEIINSTAFIKCVKDTVVNGQKKSLYSSGSSFSFRYMAKDSSYFTVLVTNAHVVRDKDSVIIQFKQNVNNTPAYQTSLFFNLKNPKDKWIFHPTEDLAILPLDIILHDIFVMSRINIFIIPIEEALIADEQDAELSAIQQVLMLGYPMGFIDNNNTVPIVRRGVTATPYKLNYNNRDRFLVDIPIYGGSSGSPILTLDEGSYLTQRAIVRGNRVRLLGINAMSVDGPFEGKAAFDSAINTSQLKNTPIKTDITTVTSLPINIAVAIKAKELLYFKPLLLPYFIK